MAAPKRAEAVMQVEELHARKNQLERDIREAVKSLVDDFESETTYTPASIDVQMAEVTGLGDKAPKYKIGDCEVCLIL